MFSLVRAPVARALAGSVAATLLLAGCGALTGGRAAGATGSWPRSTRWPRSTGRVAGENTRSPTSPSPAASRTTSSCRSRQTADVEQAALVVFEQASSRPWTPRSSRTPRARSLDVADVVELRPFADHDGEDHGDEEHGADDGHDHGDLDPHFWLDPLLMADVADAVADELGELDPDHADDVRRQRGRRCATS